MERPFELFIGQHGAKSRVLVDGVDLSRMCRGIRLMCRVGSTTKLDLELAAVEGPVTGEALVRWHCPQPIAAALEAARRMADAPTEDNRAALDAALVAFFWTPWGA